MLGRTAELYPNVTLRVLLNENLVNLVLLSAQVECLLLDLNEEIWLFF